MERRDTSWNGGAQDGTERDQMERRVIRTNGESLLGTERNRIEWTGWYGEGRAGMERDCTGQDGEGLDGMERDGSRDRVERDGTRWGGDPCRFETGGSSPLHQVSLRSL